MEVAVSVGERLALRAVVPRPAARPSHRTFRPLCAGGVFAARTLLPPRLTATSGRTHPNSPACVLARRRARLPAMKLFLAIFVYLLIGALLSWGILLAMGGKPWLLVGSLIAYIVAFGRIGCTAH